jgi:hypothetical protein
LDCRSPDPGIRLAVRFRTGWSCLVAPQENDCLISLSAFTEFTKVLFAQGFFKEGQIAAMNCGKVAGVLHNKIYSF